MISKATLGRIPVYLRYLKKLPSSVTNISATTLSKELSLGEVQVRKDLASACGKGKPRVGYSVKELVSGLERVLSGKSNKEAVIVGAGKLGMAFLGYAGFTEYGIAITKAFDTDSRKWSEDVLPMSELKSYCSLHQIELGILTVPTNASQKALDEMVASGIKGIWCFSSSHLQVPEGVVVQYENMALSLAHLQNKIG